MNLTIYTLEKTLYEGEIQELVAKTVTGEISILPNHIPLISRLVPSSLKIIEKLGEVKILVINAGFLEVQPENKVTILLDTI